MAIDREEIADRLELVGLSSDEARLYVRLLQLGPTKASDLVDEIDVSRATVYRMLDRLANEGYVLRLPGEPTTYRAEDPRQVFETEIADVETRRERLEEARERLEDELSQLGEPPAREERFFQEVEGWGQIANAFGTVMVRAEDRLAYVDTYGVGDEAPAQATVAERLSDRARGGLAVQALFADQQRPAGLAEEVEIRELTGTEPHVLVLADERDLLQVTTFEGGQAPRALWTNAPGLTASARLAFDRLWEQADG